MPNIVLIKHNRNWGLDEAEVKRTASKVLRQMGLKGVELSLVFVGRKKARDLNIRYRKMDYVPQVLAFPIDKEMLGDVVICTQKLKREKAGLEEWLRHGIENCLRG